MIALAAAVALAPAAHAGGPTMVLGATEDAVRSPTLAGSRAQMDLLKLAGFGAVRITQIWAPGETAVSPEDATIIGNVTAAAAADGIEVFASVLSYGSATTPLSDTDQADFAAYAASIVTSAPSIRHVIVGNEPNLNRYWLPQFAPDGSDAAAAAYESLLAKTYDALKAADPTVEVIGGAVSPRGGDRPDAARQTHSPTAFIDGLGAAYRASGRTTPIMDAFAIHPYEDNSGIAPVKGLHPRVTTIAIGDYWKLVPLLGQAFDGTAQAGSTLPIYYDEFGVESQIPAAKASLYTGVEPVTTHPVDEQTQALYYREAVQLAFCQPNVRGLFLFHTVDETDLNRWQSGVYYADGTPKASLAGTKLALEEARRGIVAHCSWLHLVPKPALARKGSRLVLTCDLDCTYVAQLYRLPGQLVATRRGRASGGPAVTLPLQVPAAAGRYRLRVSVRAAVNPGKPVLRLLSFRH